MTTSTLFVDGARPRGVVDREALGAVKAQVNRFGTPTATELQSSNDMFFSALPCPGLAWPGQRTRRAKILSMGYGVPSDFELNFGKHLPALGRADDDDTDMSSPTDRRPGFLNSAPTFDVRQRPVNKCGPQ